jgi:polyphosphate kinase 1
MQSNRFFDRDISWLVFNERVLAEAANKEVPLLERIRFLAIYSSNLDEFYRVRMPAIMALQKIKKKENQLEQAKQRISRQLSTYGNILTQQIIPALKTNGIHLVYNEPIPDEIIVPLRSYFYTHVLAFLQTSHSFPENNKLYLLVNLGHRQVILNIPSDHLDRFHLVNDRYVVFLDDIIKFNLPLIFRNEIIKGCYSFKITRDAELELEAEYEGDLAKKLEKQLAKRDFGLATRLLYEPGLPVQSLVTTYKLQHAMVVEGGCYHNLKDLMNFPVKNSALSYPKWPAVPKPVQAPSIFDEIAKKDIVLHTPYQSYDIVLRFFNEAAIDDSVTDIFVTLYRIAHDSRVANALVSAARNGKKVTVLVELKARFDEANNIRWAKKMKEAGVKIVYSPVSLKVHAKVALVKRKQDKRTHYMGLLATGNMNEGTARFYTDHVLFTAHPGMLRELELLFIFLGHKKKAGNPALINFEHLLVAQFNLQQRFLELIDREIAHARQGLPASIIIKLNNLEERVLIEKLYEASRAGVSIRLVVRGICCLVPGIPGMSEHIVITRIVDRYLEHGRLFVFHNNGQQELYMGSADWMNRNIYRRIEVCFPVYDEGIKQELLQILDYQLNDNVQAVVIDPDLNNKSLPVTGAPVRSQEAIYRMLSAKNE